ncbi:hypothetical protein GCM10023175_25910 [Pseudonocardia xishanensis]|uniref:DUF732 domain-containing protein n=1 Tax=Pseudonocardia xishanensis TaxID=630995 RepID=A0ABP8RQW6_9PSEU
MLGVLLVPLALSACGGTSSSYSEGYTDGASPAATAQAPEALTTQEAAFVTQARAIAPRIVGDDERLAARASNTCSSLTDGKSDSQITDVAVERFSSGSYQVTRTEAEQLVEAARTTVCAAG